MSFVEMRKESEDEGEITGNAGQWGGKTCIENIYNKMF